MTKNTKSETNGTGTWTKFNGTWMVRVEGDIAVDGDALFFEVTAKSGKTKVVATMNEPEWTKDGVAIYCPIEAARFSRVAERNARANAKADGAIERNGSYYHI